MKPRWPHQEAALAKFRNAKVASLNFEQRCGKSRVVIEKAVHHFAAKQIDAVLVVSWPAGVHTNWIVDEFPEWMPPGVPWRGMIWRSNKASQVGYNRDFDDLLAFKGLAVLSINAEALPSETTRSFITRFLKTRRAMGVADESSFMANWCARTRIMLNIAKLCPVRMTLDGTPADEGPFDLYFQYAFLSTSIIGQPNVQAFRNRYAEMEVTGDQGWREAMHRGLQKAAEAGIEPAKAETFAMNYAKNAGRSWTAVKETTNDDGTRIKAYRNIDELKAKIAPHSMRITFAQAFPDAQVKVYAKRYVTLNKEQRRVYAGLKEEFIASLKTGDVNVATAIVRLTRFQQICSGYWPAQKVATVCGECAGDGCTHCDWRGAFEDDVPLQRLGDDNPRLEGLKLELQAIRGSIVVWARFIDDIDQVMQLGADLNRVPMRYDGRVGDDAKLAARRAFQAGDCGLLVGNEASLQRGIRLDRAAAMIGYSNYFSLRMRRQIEDRGKSPERTTALSIIDIVAEDTVDDKTLLPSLREKRRLADIIMNDKPEEWV